MKTEDCNFCGTKGARIWTDGEYEALKCSDCGVVWVSPQPDEKQVQRIYSGDYYRRWYLSFEEIRKEYFRERLKAAERVLSAEKSPASIPGRLLDIGCGVGFFLEAAKERGWKAEGTEISDFARGYAGKKGFSVHAGCEGLEDGSFDMVVMMDVLAHVADPAGYINKAKALLKKGGALVIKTPDHPARLFRMAGIFSFTGRSRGLLHIPAQLFHFDPGNLAGVVERAGLRPVRTEKVREALRGGWTSSGLKNSLVRLFNAAASAAGIGESFIVYAIKP